MELQVINNVSPDFVLHCSIFMWFHLHCHELPDTKVSLTSKAVSNLVCVIIIECPHISSTPCIIPWPVLSFPGRFRSPASGSRPHFHLHCPRQLSTLPSPCTSPDIPTHQGEQMLVPILAALHLARVLDGGALPDPLPLLRLRHSLALLQLDSSPWDGFTSDWDSGTGSKVRKLKIKFKFVFSFQWQLYPVSWLNSQLKASKISQFQILLLQW